MRTHKATSIVLALAFIPFPFQIGGTSVFDRSDIRTEVTNRGVAVEGELLVKYKGEESFRVEKLPRSQSLEAAERSFRGRGDVEYAEPNYIMEAFAAPNDPYFSFQWNFSKIGLPAAWASSTGSGVTVAVIDTGVAYENFTQGSKKFYLAPDLAGTTFIAGYDFVSNDTHPNDDNGHGTHVAGTIAQSTNNATGVAGVAYDAKIMPIKVLSASGSGTTAAVANGIKFAANNGAKVINLSLGGSASSALHDAVKYAHTKGVVIIAASGNNNGAVRYPAAYDQYVIAVGATRYDNARAPYSNYGASLDLVAPGGDTKVDQNGDGYGDGILQQTFAGALNNFGYYFFQGTSMATPHVAGVAALVIARGKATTTDDVRVALESTALDLGADGRDNFFGFGLVNAGKALAFVPNTPPPPNEPLGPPQDPPTPTEVEVYADSFEVAEWNNLWTEDFQNDWYRSNQRATAGTFSAEVDGSANNAALTSIPLNLQGKTNATVTFSWLIESSLDTNEYVTFETSSNGGSTWTERARLRGNVNAENVWHPASYTLENTSNLRLRFRGKMSDSSEEANIDAVKVVAW